MWNNLKIGTRLLLAFGGLALVVLLLNYLMDSRTGLGRFREFRISNY